MLFVGNSYTYGPRPFGQVELNNLPRLFKLVAESLGKCVNVSEDTIGGCTLHAHRPSLNPDGCAPCHCPHGSPACSLAERAAAPSNCSGCGCNCKLVNNTNRGIAPSDGCTVGNKTVVTERPVVSNGTAYGTDYHTCPQLLVRKKWDYVVLQDHSQLPTVRAARKLMLNPAVEEYAEYARQTGAKLAMFMTHAFFCGMKLRDWPSGHNFQGAACYPYGTLQSLTPNYTTWKQGSNGSACMNYALARAYGDAAVHAADLLVPCGIAWQAARGFPPAPAACRAVVDAEYDPGVPSGLPPTFPPPRAVGNTSRWAGDAGLQLYRWMGPSYPSGSTYCDVPGCKVDQHPSVLGSYLNALVFYATIFREAPTGAAAPAGQIVDGAAVPGAGAIRGDGAVGAVTADEAAALQRVAAAVVLPDLQYWHPRTPPRAPSPPQPAAAPAGWEAEKAELEGKIAALQRACPAAQPQ